MARIRTIKPEFWVDDALVELPMSTRLLFIGLWNFADDEGYFEHKPRRIKMQIFPADDYGSVPVALRELIACGRLTEMDSDQGPLLKITNWERHQSINHATRTRFTGIRAIPTVVLPEESGSTPVVLPDPSRLKGREGKGRDKDSPKIGGVEFEEFWNIYPRRIAREPAERAYTSAAKRAGHAAIRNGARAFAIASRGTEAKYIPYPASWLNAGRWTDTIAPAKPDPDAWMQPRPKVTGGTLADSNSFGAQADLPPTQGKSYQPPIPNALDGDFL